MNGEVSVGIWNIASVVLPIIGMIGVALINNKSIKDKLSKEHVEVKGALSGEHKDLSKENLELKSKLDIATDKVQQIANATAYLRDEAHETKIRRELATQQELNVVKIQEQLSGYAKFVQHLKEENVELKSMVAALKKENMQLKQLLNQQDMDEDRDL